MTLPLFPALPGIGWSSFKRPIFSTRVATHLSGREVRAVEYVYPLYEFELTIELLRAGAEQELQTLLGFFLACQGQFAPFRYLDPGDHSAAGQSLGLGDGVTNTFTGLRDLGGWIEPVGTIESVQALYLNGVAQSGGWSVAGNAIVFATAPAAGARISADFTFAYLCRFLDDKHTYEQFLSGLWANKSVKFRSVRSA
jgi:uncharacterized protein (TIGR02217 family)